MLLSIKNKIKPLALFGILGIFIYCANATETVGFTFYYESGITDVNYEYNKIYEGSHLQTPIVSKPAGLTTVSVTAKMDDEKSIANDFINKLNPMANTHMVGLDTTDIEPNKLDFWIQGILSINGEIVSNDFYLARIPDQWWLGTTVGTSYTGVSGNNSQTNRGIQVYGLTTKLPYCLKEVGGDYYNVHVYQSLCDATDQTQYDWSNAKNENMSFQYSSGVESVAFEYYGSHDAMHNGYDYLESVEQSTSSSKKLDVTIRAKIADLSTIADSYNTIFDSFDSINFQGALQSIPASLAFWVKGHLIINGQLITDVTIAQDSKKWYIGAAGGVAEASNEVTITAAVSGDQYCLTGINKNTISVAAGSCSASNKETQELNFIYESGIESINFIYTNGNYFVKAGTIYNESQQHFSNINGNWLTVTIYENTKLSTSVAKNYSSLFMNGQHSMSIDPGTPYNFIPTKMKYYIQGTLQINGHSVANDFAITSKQYGRVIGSINGVSDQIDDSEHYEYNQNYMDFTAQDNNNLHYCILSLSKGTVNYFYRPYDDEDVNVWVYEGTCSSIGYIS